MAQTVKLRRSALPGRVPNNAQLELGELSMNTTDGKIFLAKSGSNGPSVEEVIITNTQNTGSIELVGSISSSFFTGSFIGDGSRLTNIQASGVTGLSLDRIANTTATASISPSGFSVNVNTSITGSLTATSITGSGLGLTDVPFHITGSDGTSTSDKQFTKLLFDDSTGIKLTETVDGVARVYLEGVAAEGSGDGRTSKLEVTESSSIWVLTHGLNERYPAITVFDSNGDVIIPQRIETVSVNQLKVYFNNPQTGVVTATLGGGLPIISASYDGRVLSVNDGVATWKDGIVSSSLQFDSTTDPFTGSFYGTFRGDIQGTANITGDFIPVLTDTYNLGSVDKQWKDLFLSSGSLYIDGTKVISSNTTELIISTDLGQSLKFLETGADDITLQTENGNIELKGTVEILSGKKILDSAGTIIQFGDSLGVTGSIEVSGTVDGIDLQQFSSSVSNLNINNDSRLGLLETASGSIINDFNTYTSSNNTTNTTQNNRIGSLEVESGSIRSEFNDFTSSLDTALEFTGSDVTIKGNLLVKGTESRINSTTIDVNDNIISLNGSGAVFGGLEVRDVTAPGVVSGSLLWDSNGNYWIGGQKGTEVRFLNTDDLTTLNVTLGTLQTESGSIRGDFNSYTQSNNSTNSDQNRRLDGLDIFSGSAKLRLNSIETLTSSLASISSVTDVRDDFNTYTSSNDATNNTQNGKLGLLETASGSIRGDFNDYTSSNNSLNNTQNGRLSSLENASGSVRNELNNYTSSNNTTNTNQNGRLTSLEVETGSINSNILTLDGRIEDVEITLGQLDSIYATDGDVTNLRNDLNAYTSSTDGRQSTQDGRLNALETKTGSLDTDITAIDSRLDSLEGVTGSFITGYTETQTLDDVTDLGSTTTNSIGVGGLDSTGAISINSTNVIDDNRRIYGSGTASNTIPAFTFAGDTNTGLSRIGEDAVGLVAAGSRKFYVSNTHAYFQNLPSGVTINGAGLRVEGNATITGSTTAGSFIKSGGSPSEFLKADGSVDENTYLTAHPSVVAATSSNNSGRTYIQDILLDSFGHISGITTATETVVNTDLYTTGATFSTVNGIITFTRNNGNTYTVDLDGRYLQSYTETDPIFTASDAFNIRTEDITNWNTSYGWGDHSTRGYLTAHPIVSAATSSDNSGRTYIQDILLDGFGHITGITTATETVVDTNNFTTGVTWNAGTATLRFTKNDGNSYDVQMLETLTDVTVTGGTYNSGSQTLRLTKSDGSTVDVSGFAIDTDVNWYTTGATFNSGNGVITGTRNDGQTWTVDIDGRFLTSYTETDTLDSVVSRGNTTARGITLGSGAPWTPLVINASAGEGTANAGVAIALDGTNYAEYGYRFKANGSNYYQVLYDGSSINWKNYNSGYETKMSLSNGGNLTLTGTISASGYNDSNWNTAYGWGNHSTSGYLTSYTDTNNFTTGATFNTGNGIITFTRNDGGTYSVDIDGKYAESAHTHTFASLTSKPTTLSGYGITDAATSAQGTKADSAYGWGNHASAGYLTAVPSSFSTNSITIGNAVTLTESTDRADLLSINSGTSGWGGLQITNTAGEGILSLMIDGSNGGLYDDQNGDWLLYYTENGSVELRYNNDSRLVTQSDGVDISGNLDVTGTLIAGNTFVNGLITGGFGSQTTDGTLDWNDSSNARSGQGYSLLLGNHSNGPTNTTQYFHPFSFEYSNKNGSGNLTQLAIPYTGYGLHYRSRYSDTWDGWISIWDTSHFSSTNISNWNTAYGWGNHASAGYLTSYTDTNNYVTGATFNTGNGIITLTKNDGTTVTVDIDGRFLTSYTETDTLASVTSRGASTTTDITVRNVLINDGSALGGTNTFDTYKRLTFSNSHSDVARGPNKITMYNNGGAWLGGFGIHSGTVSYYSGDNHTWYKSDSQTSFTEVMRLSNGGNLTLLGTLSASGYNKTNWDTAYGWGNHASAGYTTTDYYTTGATFNSGTGIVTFTRNNGATYTLNIAATLTDVTVTGGTYNSGTQTLRLTKSDGNTVDVSGFAIDTDVNWYTTGATFNNSNGIITGTHQGGTWTVDIDGRYLELGGGTLTGDLTVGAIGKTSDSVIRVLAEQSYKTGFEAYGNGQGTGYLYVGQSAEYGGGISYNGDGAPAFVNGETADYITFYRREAGTNTEVFAFPYSNNNVYFNGEVHAGGGNSSQWNTAYGWGNHAGLYSLVSHTHTFASLTSKPTTISGYGITDAITTSNIGSQNVSSANILNSLGNYIWNASSLPSTFSGGITTSFVSDGQGFPSYGSLMMMKTYDGGGGSLQLYTPYSELYGGSRIGVRFGNYASSNGNSWTGWKYLLNSVSDPYAYNMNQNVRTTDAVTFTTITATGGNSGNWNTAYGWGDHSTSGYLTSYTDTNNFTTGATFNTGNGIITFTRNNGNTYTVDIDGKYAESVHTHDDRYFTETESDARYPLSRGAIGTSTTVGDATGFGNNKVAGTYTRGYVGHSGQVMMSHDTGGSVGNVGIETTYYGAMYVHTNVDSSSWVTKQIWTSYNFTSTNITNWDTAYGWGDHSTRGYLTSHPTISGVSSNNSGRTYIQDILTDANGHITGVTTATETVVNTDTNYYTTGSTFNSTSGVLTFTRNNGGSYTVDISATLTDVTVTGGTYNSGTQTLRLTKSNGTTLDVSGFAIDTDVNWYVTGATFNTGNGIISLTRNDGTTVTVDIDGKYAESAHTHTFASLTSKPTTLAGYGITDASSSGHNHDGTYVRSYTTSAGDIDADWGQSFKTFDPIPTGTPPRQSPNIRTINVGNDFNRRTQLAFDYATDQAWFRRRNDSGWQTWREFIHSGNISTQSVSYADSAGTSSSATTSSQLTVNSGNTSAGWYPITWHSGNTVYSSSGVEIYAAGNYIRSTYINTSDNDETDITRFVIKNGDNYHRSATATAAANVIRGVASGSWGINITGSAASATTATNLGADYTADDWFRATGDNNPVKFYGNTYQMTFRTDGASEAYSGIGGYPFVWSYGGSTSGTRIMLLADTGRLWTKQFGWLDEAFASSAQGTNADTAYGWGNHASGGYIVKGSTVAETSSWADATKFRSNGDISQTTAGNHSLQVYADINNDAFMAFHISSDYAVYFGLENATNRLYTGGWSTGADKHQIWDSRDFSSTNISNWNTSYGWGNHAGLYLSASGKAADSELLDGVDSGYYVKSGAGASVSGWLIDAFRNGSGTSPRIYMSASTGYGMHINTYNTSASVYGLEIHNNAMTTFMVYNDGDVIVGKDLEVTGDLKMQGTDSYIWTPNTAGGFTGFWDQYNSRIAANFSNNVGWGFLGDPESGYAIKSHGSIRTTGSVVASGSVNSGSNFYADANYGYGLVGLYSSTRYQGVFAMGDSYKLSADGTTTGSLYGIAWTHSNVGGQSISGLSHQMLIMENGTTRTALGTGVWTNGNVEISNSTGSWFKNGNAWFGRNHAYDTAEIRGYGSELMIGSQGTELHINYRTCNNGTANHTPTNWYWRAGSSTSYSNHFFGEVRAQSFVTVNGDRIGSGTLSVRSGGAGGVGWGTGLNLGDSSSYYSVIQDANISRFRNYGGGGYQWFNSSGSVAILELTNGGDLLPYNGVGNLGSSTRRWANIYTNDLHLSNEGKVGGNDVDGTTGSWTIQEGSEDLYLINNKNGKKYKISLSEV